MHPLTRFLEPIQVFLDDPDVTEVLINEPEYLFVETRDGKKMFHAPKLNAYWLSGLAKLIANQAKQVFNQEFPLLTTALPCGVRVQMVMPPACLPGQQIFAFRKSSKRLWMLEDCEKMGLFDQCPEMTAYIKNMIQKKQNLLIIGATNSGKTTLLNACLNDIPEDERIICLEDVPEINIKHKNKVHLLANHPVSLQDLAKTCLRLTPDRVIFGEIRGQEAEQYWQLMTTGHTGLLATLHASNPEVAMDRLAYLAKLAGHPMSMRALKDQFNTLIDDVIELGMVKGLRKVLRTSQHDSR